MSATEASIARHRETVAGALTDTVSDQQAAHTVEHAKESPDEPVILLEFNELNFEYIEKYIALGFLPTFRELLTRYGYTTTTSEQCYEEIEPWIQWVTAHTGLTLSEHGVFRLGDITRTDIPQIWDQVEEELGIRVGAVCPMNAVNRLRNPAFFVPDPWTETPVSGPLLLRHLSAAVSQAVNDNAQSKLRLRSILALLAGWAAYATRDNWRYYFSWALSARKNPWRQAMFLDCLLADIFFKEWRKTRPDFASLFLNAGAHIQHHYMFSSQCYNGPHQNPAWYIDDKCDPVLEVYAAYDRILARALKAPRRPRLLIATGLHQDPHDELTYYWRLRNHAEFLSRVGLSFADVQPRMSRDFLVICRSTEEAAAAERVLVEAQADDGQHLFSVDNRGTDLFVTLKYPRNVKLTTTISINGCTIHDFREHVVFVALKNGKHNGIGYLVDSGSNSTSMSTNARSVELVELPARIRAALQSRAAQATL